MKRIAFALLLFISPFTHAADPYKPTAPLLTGMSNHTMPITTSEPWAQRFFDQGIMLSYAFNHAEAHRSFMEASKLDPNCAMAYWGAALVLGPNINSAMDPSKNAEAYELSQKAIELAPKVSEKERALIRALELRYMQEAPADRAPLDRAYAEAMRDVARKYPADADIQSLFAESLMDLSPWNYWKPDGEPQPGTPELLRVLEATLASAPNHPLAHHLYIHAVEASKDPGRATPSADRLRDLAPGAGHLVHMPSHIYIRTGRYADGILANEKAIEADNRYLDACHAQGAYPLAYVPHNHHFLWACATIAGNKEKAVMAAKTTQEAVMKDMMGCCGMGSLQHYYIIPLYAYVRFGMWDEILNEPKPADTMPYQQGIWHHARGMAFTRTGKLDEAQVELDALKPIAKDKRLDGLTIWEINELKHLLDIGVHVLAGEIAAAKGKHGKAIAQLEKAIAIEDSLQYQEPPDWFFPVRHSLGAVLLDAGKPEQAEAVYRADLEKYPANGWSLIGLKQSLEAQGRAAEAQAVEEQFQQAWQVADIEITRSRF